MTGQYVWWVRKAFLGCVLLGYVAVPASRAMTPDPSQLGGILACSAARPLIRDLPRETLFAEVDGICTVSSTLDGTRFLDASCTTPIQTETQTFQDYCESVTIPGLLGDGAGLTAQVGTWLSTPGTRVPLTLPGLGDSAEPFLGRLKYRDVVQASGDVCSLEMRVYTAHPGAVDQPAVMAFHGGSWSGRRTGFPGLESLIAHFTDRGMVVFAPFYRLAGYQDGPAACQGWVAEDIVDDAEFALDWVLENGADYGAAAGNPVLFGQSAGAFLATWLAVEREPDTAAALLMYPPTDVGDFATQAISGQYTNVDGVEILERFLDEPTAEWLPSSPRFGRLSLAQRVANGDPVSPLRIVHGLEDDLVTPRQAQLLCAAARSQADWQDAVDEDSDGIGGSTRTENCGELGQLDLLAGAGHALEVCIPGIACQAGNLLEAAVATASLNNAYDWVQDRGIDARTQAEQDAEPDDPPPDEGTPPTDENPSDEDSAADDTPEAPSSGGGGGGVFALILSVGLYWRRRLRPAL